MGASTTLLSLNDLTFLLFLGLEYVFKQIFQAGPYFMPRDSTKFWQC